MSGPGGVGGVPRLGVAALHGAHTDAGAAVDGRSPEHPTGVAFSQDGYRLSEALPRSLAGRVDASAGTGPELPARGIPRVRRGRAGSGSSREAAQQLRRLRRLIQSITRDTGLRLRAGEAWTYDPAHNTITYPAAELAGLSDELCMGAICHELAYRLFSVGPGEAGEDAGFRHLWSCIEDIRVNRMMSAHLVGARRYLAALYADAWPGALPEDASRGMAQAPERQGPMARSVQLTVALRTLWAADLTGPMALVGPDVARGSRDAREKVERVLQRLAGRVDPEVCDVAVQALPFVEEATRVAPGVAQSRPDRDDDRLQDASRRCVEITREKLWPLYQALLFEDLQDGLLLQDDVQTESGETGRTSLGGASESLRGASPAKEGAGAEPPSRTPQRDNQPPPVSGRSAEDTEPMPDGSSELDASACEEAESVSVASEQDEACRWAPEREATDAEASASLVTGTPAAGEFGGGNAGPAQAPGAGQRHARLPVDTQEAYQRYKSSLRQRLADAQRGTGEYEALRSKHANLIKTTRDVLDNALADDAVRSYQGYHASGHRYDVRRGLQSRLAYMSTGRYDPKVYRRRTEPQIAQTAIVFCVDASASMSGAPMQNAKEALVVFLEALRDFDRVDGGVVVFGDRATVAKGLQTPMAGHRQDELLAALTPRGSTNDTHALRTAAEMLRDSHAEQRLVLLLTDGDGDRDQARTVAELEAEGTVVIGIHATDGASSAGHEPRLHEHFCRVYPNHVLVRDVQSVPSALGEVLCDRLATGG